LSSEWEARKNRNVVDSKNYTKSCRCAPPPRCCSSCGAISSYGQFPFKCCFHMNCVLTCFGLLCWHFWLIVSYEIWTVVLAFLSIWFVRVFDYVGISVCFLLVFDGYVGILSDCFLRVLDCYIGISVRLLRVLDCCVGISVCFFYVFWTILLAFLSYYFSRNMWNREFDRETNRGPWTQFFVCKTILQ
jgi:hypothetical protein